VVTVITEPILMHQDLDLRYLQQRSTAHKCRGETRAVCVRLGWQVTEAPEKMRIEGSPSFVLKQGRQKPYGNVWFQLIEASIQELLRAPCTDRTSWCSFQRNVLAQGADLRFSEDSIGATTLASVGSSTAQV
jgi:hypothetical protein